jgi:hypothetical protein
MAIAIAIDSEYPTYKTFGRTDWPRWDIPLSSFAASAWRAFKPYLHLRQRPTLRRVHFDLPVPGIQRSAYIDLEVHVVWTPRALENFALPLLSWLASAEPSKSDLGVTCGNLTIAVECRLTNTASIETHQSSQSVVGSGLVTARGARLRHAERAPLVPTKRSQPRVTPRGTATREKTAQQRSVCRNCGRPAHGRRVQTGPSTEESAQSNMHPALKPSCRCARVRIHSNPSRELSGGASV